MGKEVKEGYEDQDDIEIIEEGDEDEAENETEEEFKKNIGYIDKLTKWEDEDKKEQEEDLDEYSKQFMVTHK